MSRITVTYDIKKEGNVHDHVKKYMIGIGYFDCFIHSVNNINYVIHLPNTTLWHPDKTCTDAREDIKAALNNFRPNGKTLLERLFSSVFTTYAYFDDDTKVATADQVRNIPSI